MVFLNHSTMQMVAKIVYYGPGLCGKTTNLKEIYRKTATKSRGEMVSLETETDRTLFFDLLPIDVGVIGGFKTKFQLYTVPGQVFYNSTRKLVLRGVDGIVFVADSQIPMLDANLDSYENLKDNLQELGLDLADVPLVFQFNKRDLPNIHPVDKLNAVLNDFHRPFIESSALKGIGVFETLKEISKQTLLKLRAKAVGNELKKSENVSLKVRSASEQMDFTDPDANMDTNPGIAAHVSAHELESIPEDAIPVNVSFDTYEIDDTGGATTLPNAEDELPDAAFHDADPDATDPSFTNTKPIAGPEASTASAGPPSLDNFDLELPEDDLLTEEDELDLNALQDLQEQVSDDIDAIEMDEDTDFEDDFSLPGDEDDQLEGLPDRPQEGPDGSPILTQPEPPAPTPPPIPKKPPKPPEAPPAEKTAKPMPPPKEAPQEVAAKAPKPSPKVPKSEPELPAVAEDTVPQEIVSVKTEPGKKTELSSTLRELENLNLKTKRPKTVKIPGDTTSVDDLLTDIMGQGGKKKGKAQKVTVNVPGKFKEAQVNCIFLDDRQNVIHTHLAKLNPIEITKGKGQIKVTFDIEVDS